MKLNDDILKAIGIDSNGRIIEFDYMDGKLNCYNCHLVSLDIPDGVNFIYAHNNLLKELIIPEGVKKIWCSNNKLTKLVIPEGVNELYCDNNKLTELNIPVSIKYLNCIDNLISKLNIPLSLTSNIKLLWCDKIVKGLENIDSDCNIRLY